MIGCNLLVDHHAAHNEEHSGNVPSTAFDTATWLQASRNKASPGTLTMNSVLKDNEIVEVYAFA